VTQLKKSDENDEDLRDSTMFIRDNDYTINELKKIGKIELESKVFKVID
jgi:hypothetical protein